MQKKELLQLIRKAKAKDPDAFSSLIYFYMKDLYRVAISILMNDEDAADAIQDTILGCWEKLYTLKEEKYFKTSSEPGAGSAEPCRVPCLRRRTVAG